MLPKSWDFSTKICDIYAMCSNPTTVDNKDVYTTEVIITSTLNQYGDVASNIPQKLRFFVWVE